MGILSKATQKYSTHIPVNVSLVVDSYGCEIVSKNKEHHEEVLKNIFREFGKAHEIEVNNRKWVLQIHKVKLDLSDDHDSQRTRFAYQDDKIIFGAREQKTGDYLCLEAITFPQKIKRRKHTSHLLYRVFREAGDLVIGKLGLYGAQHMCNVFSKQAESSEEENDAVPPMPLGRYNSDMVSNVADVPSPLNLARNHSQQPKNDASKTSWWNGRNREIDSRIVQALGKKTIKRLDDDVKRISEQVVKVRDNVKRVHEVTSARGQNFFTPGSKVKVISTKHSELKDNEIVIVQSSDGRTGTVVVKRKSDMKKYTVPKDILEIISEARAPIQAGGIVTNRNVRKVSC